MNQSLVTALAVGLALLSSDALAAPLVVNACANNHGTVTISTEQEGSEQASNQLTGQTGYWASLALPDPSALVSAMATGSGCFAVPNHAPTALEREQERQGFRQASTPVAAQYLLQVRVDSGPMDHTRGGGRDVLLNFVPGVGIAAAMHNSGLDNYRAQVTILVTEIRTGHVVATGTSSTYTGHVVGEFQFANGTRLQQAGFTDDPMGKPFTTAIVAAFNDLEGHIGPASQH